MTGRRKTLLLGLIGADIQASRSPVMYEREAAAHGLDCIYQRLDLASLGATVRALSELLDMAERMGFRGVNITHPCKQEVMPLLTDLSEEVRAVGAVNTVVFDDGKRVGHNTDWWGFGQSFRERLPNAPIGRVVQLGAGGAGAATGYAILELGAGELIVVDTICERASSLAERLATLFPGRVRAADDLEAALHRADGLIHATPTGMAAYPGLPLPASLLRTELWIAEVVYFPLDTALLQTAQSLGCQTMDGSGMAILQAVEAFRLFTGLTADASRMRGHFESFGGEPQESHR